MAITPKKPASKTPRKPARPKNLPHGRWLGDFPNLSAAELRLVECCGKGEIWVPHGWDWENSARPEVESDGNRIRADLVRFLALGGDALHPVQESGVRVWGAWITGTLDLHKCRAPAGLDLSDCHFVGAPDFMAAELYQLALIGSRMPGLDADGMKVAGDVFLRDGFTAIGEVRLLGAEIGGDLSCIGGRFTNAVGEALFADRMKVAGGVFLRDGFSATGAVRLSGAEIGGDLDCVGGRFATSGGHALNIAGMKLARGFLLRQPMNNTESKHRTVFDGSLSASAARIATLIDDLSCWQSGGHILDGLHYDRIIGPRDAPARIAWLKSQRKDQLDDRDWSPQPWEQLIKVLRETGHPGAAAEIAMEKQRMMRAAGQIGTRIPRTDFKRPLRRKLDAWWTKLSNFLAHAFHDFYGWIAGYGHRPSRIAWRMLTIWLACSLLYWAAADQFAAFGPANPVITSPTLYPEADLLCGHGNETDKQRWTECPGVPDEYSTFQPFIYSLDVILPLIDLHQEVDWAPIAEGPTGSDLPMGVVVRWFMWFEILFGWLASLMFVAIVSRLVDKD